MARVLNLLNLHTEFNLGEITRKRTIATLTFLGRYAFCDVALSNFGNSGINSTAVLVKKNIRSLIKHMDNSKAYAENTKLGSTIMLYNEQYANNELYNTDLNNIEENKWVLNEREYTHIVIAPSHIIYRLDFQNVLKQHIENKSEITVCYKKCNTGKNDFIKHDIFTIDNFNHLKGISTNKGTENNINVSMETYIINTKTLLKMIDYSNKTSQFFTIRDVINQICSSMEVVTYEYNGYLRCIDSLEGYLKYSLEMLDIDVQRQICTPNWPIYTKTHDTPPARYLNGAWVRNSIISNGAIIDGKVSDSIICRNVKIGKNCEIKNSIILSDSVISDDCVLENVIVDKNCKVIYVKELKGTKDKPLYIKQGDVV